MKLKIKFQDEDLKLGEICDAQLIVSDHIIVQAKATSGGVHTFYYNSIKDFAEDWEHYEEPTDVYYIDYQGDIHCADIDNNWSLEKIIGNYFSSKKEAEEAVEKLKTWKRLKDKGFRFDGWDVALRRAEPCDLVAFVKYDGGYTDEIKADLDLLFGGDE